MMLPEEVPTDAGIGILKMASSVTLLYQSTSTKSLFLIKVASRPISVPTPLSHVVEGGTTEVMLAPVFVVLPIYEIKYGACVTLKTEILEGTDALPTTPQLPRNFRLLKMFWLFIKFSWLTTQPTPMDGK